MRVQDSLERYREIEIDNKLDNEVYIDNRISSAKSTLQQGIEVLGSFFLLLG
jgi:hypothetical protein